jgi:O-acetyl-ADP-ribose deacetylase (regulator of RNase III)
VIISGDLVDQQVDAIVNAVIHATRMGLGGHTTTRSLKSSMYRVFRLAGEHNVRSIAVPAVGTGIAGFRWMNALA